MLGLPAIAVSQQSRRGALDYRFDGGFAFEVAAAFVARLVERIEDVPLPASDAAQRQRPRRRRRAASR